MGNNTPQSDLRQEKKSVPKNEYKYHFQFVVHRQVSLSTVTSVCMSAMYF